MFLFAVAVSLIAAVSAIADLNCTTAGAYSPQANICQNTYSDQTCKLIYVNSTVQPGATTERPLTCFNGTTGPSEDIKSLAVASCPKTCGYCCQTQAYSCDNAKYPRIQCSSVTNRMCLDPTWRNVIAEDCPAACGFCLLGGCIDTAPDCNLQPTVCVTKGLEAFVASNCQRTCGICGSGVTNSILTTTARTSTGTCADNNKNCASWASQRFLHFDLLHNCSEVFQTVDQPAALCGK